MPAHSHTATLHAEDELGDKPGPAAKMLARPEGNEKLFRNPEGDIMKDMAPQSISVSSTGGGQGFPVRGPYQGVTMCISMTGTYPSRS